MAQQDPQTADRSQGLWLDPSSFPSNNPFLRNSIVASGAAARPKSPSSPFDDPPARPLSRNPFLDPSLPVNRPQSAVNIMDAPQTAGSLSPSGPNSPTVDEIFGSLNIEGTPEVADTLIDTSDTLIDTSDPLPKPGQDGANAVPRRTAPPPPARPPPHGEAKQRRPAPRPGAPPNTSPQRRHRTSRTANADSIDFNAKPITDEEKEQIMRLRRREIEKQTVRQKIKGHFDTIDLLDRTGLCTVHHDGPFDAALSHRNRKGSRRAPMQAFPEGSLNNTLGGSGPINERPDHATFMGTAVDEAFKDFATSGKIYDSKAESVFDPTSRGAVIHGDESIGLGTSTFLEGTPAALTTIQKQQQEKALLAEQDGIQRKKSLAHRIRHINKGGNYGPSGRMTNPEIGYRRMSPEGSLSAQPTVNEEDPFENEFSKGQDDIDVKPTSPPMHASDPFHGSSRGMVRRGTADSIDDAQHKGGILSRMKSLKGNRRRASDAQEQSPPVSAV